MDKDYCLPVRCTYKHVDRTEEGRDDHSETVGRWHCLPSSWIFMSSF